MDGQCAKEPQVLKLLKVVAESAAGFTQLAEALKGRTAPVTAPITNEIAKGEEIIQDVATCVVAANLMEINAILKVGDATLQSILQRLEI